jgi:hypothetical protein
MTKAETVMIIPYRIANMIFLRWLTCKIVYKMTPRFLNTTVKNKNRNSKISISSPIKISKAHSQSPTSTTMLKPTGSKKDQQKKQVQNLKETKALKNSLPSKIALRMLQSTKSKIASIPIKGCSHR